MESENIKSLGKIPEPVEAVIQDRYGSKSEPKVSSKSEVSLNVLEEGQCKELCQSGACNADCCGCVSFLESHFKALKKFIPDENQEYYLEKYKDNGFKYVKPLTKNQKCVFLNKNNSCSIHHSHLRPNYCKCFGEISTNPMSACIHINKDVEKELAEFRYYFLLKEARNGNEVAKFTLEQFKSYFEEQGVIEK